VWQFRDLLTTLAVRDVKLRYRQTALGALWVVLQPLIAAGIFTFVFSRIAGLSSDGVPYFAFAFAGQLAWMAFASTLTKTSASLVGNAQLVSKVFFPRLVLPLSTIFATLVDFCVGMVLMALLMVLFGIVPGWGFLLLPVWLLLIVLLATGIGLFTSALMVSYRDINYILPVMTQFLIYATPVGWGLSEMVTRIPERFHAIYFLLNPLASFIEAFRWSLFGRGYVSWDYIGYATAVTVFLLVAGAFAFKRMERRFADVI
jgi:lipopolysaccharide transport system permease protein